MNSDIAKLYSSPQQGGELPYFVGKQYGSGWMSSLGRYAFPILKNVVHDAINYLESKQKGSGCLKRKNIYKENKKNKRRK